MDFLMHLWIPILASAAAVWMASAIVWMALPHHKDDLKGLPDEAAFKAFLATAKIPPGTYGFPHAKDRKDCHSPEFKEAFKNGPAGFVNIWKPMTGMGANMLTTFVVYLVVSTLIAYLGWNAMGPGTAHIKVFQVLGTAGVLSYCFAFIPNGIWFQTPCKTLMMNVLDGIAYGLITGGLFAWLWPSA